MHNLLWITLYLRFKNGLFMSLHRFLTAQEQSYPQALTEIRQGKKQTHWMWYVFPQLRGLGRSGTAHFYGIENKAEATAYLAHPVLGARLREITEAALAHRDKTALQIFGHPDNLKFHSSLTLFSAVSPAADRTLFTAALNLFFAGIPDAQTLTLLS